MTTNPLTASTHEADDEPMVMVNIDDDGGAADAHRQSSLPEGHFGGDTSESGSEDESGTRTCTAATCTAATCTGLGTCPAGPRDTSAVAALPSVATLPPAPILPPTPTVGLCNLGSVLRVAIESAEAVGRTGQQRKKQAISLVHAMAQDAGPTPGTPDAIALQSFLQSDALGDVMDLVVTASRGELRVNTRTPSSCARAISRMAKNLFKN